MPRARSIAGLVCALSLAVSAAPAAAVTVGQAVVPDSSCGSESYDAMLAVSSGTPYTAPVDGTLTSFATRSWHPSGGATSITLMAFRADPITPGNYIVVGVADASIALPATEPLADLTAAITPIPVLAGDVIGFYTTGDNFSLCWRSTGSSGDVDAFDFGPAPTVGESLTLDPIAGYRLSISAELEPATGPAYADTVLADEPAGFWRLGEPSGVALLDSSPNGNDGVYQGGALLNQPGALAGDPDTAARFDGVNDVGVVPDDPTLDVGSSFTAEGWIKRSSTAQSHQLMNKGGNGLQVMVMNAGAGGQVWLRKTNITTIARSDIPGGVPADGEFHHIVVTMNGANSAKIYVDGVQSTVTLSTTQVIQNTAFNLLFGSGASSAATFDELALYDDALTPAEVSEHYAAGTGASAT